MLMASGCQNKMQIAEFHPSTPSFYKLCTPTVSLQGHAVEYKQTWWKQVEFKLTRKI